MKIRSGRASQWISTIIYADRINIYVWFAKYCANPALFGRIQIKQKETTNKFAVYCCLCNVIDNFPRQQDPHMTIYKNDKRIS